MGLIQKILTQLREGDNLVGILRILKKQFFQFIMSGQNNLSGSDQKICKPGPCRTLVYCVSKVCSGKVMAHEGIHSQLFSGQRAIKALLLSLVIGLGQIFVARVGSGQPSLVWVIWKISPKNPKFFNFFRQKNLTRSGQKVPGSKTD